MSHTRRWEFMNITLDWHGPFSVVKGTDLPLVFDASPTLIDRPGVYLWTINRDHEELVHYVGKTDRSFRTRLSEEFVLSKPELCWIPDIEKLQKGVKQWLYEPRSTRRPNADKWAENAQFLMDCRRRYLQAIRIFIAPMDCGRAEIKNTETALMWAIWDHEEAAWNSDEEIAYYLINGSPIPERLSTPYKITMRSNSRFRGLGDSISG